MKTKTQQLKRSYLMQLFLVALAICTINTARAFKSNRTYYTDNYILTHDTSTTSDSITGCNLNAHFTCTKGSNGAFTFNSTSAGTTASTTYEWYPGNGSPSLFSNTTASDNYTYPYNGTYIVELYASNGGGCYSITYDTIVVTNSQTCNLSANISTVKDTSGIVNFTSSSTGTTSGSTYSWTFGDGSSSTAQNPTYTYVYNGTYYCLLTVTNGLGCSSTVGDTVHVTNATGNPCNLHANFTYTVGVNGHTSFTSTSTGTTGYFSYTWNAGDGTGSYTTGPSFSHIYTANGNYTAILTISSDTVNDSAYCVSIDTVLINVTNITTPCMLGASFTSVVNANGQVVYTSTSANTNSGTEYFWNAGDGSPIVKGSSTFTHTYVYQGTYYPWLTLRDTGSAYCVDSTYEYVSAYTADSNECHLVANFSYSVGVNGHVSFTNTSSTINTNLNSYWNFGDGGNDFTSSRTDSHIYTANGTYTVTLTASADSALCLDSISEVITISNVTIPCTLNADFTISNDTTTGMVYVSSVSTGTYSGTQYTWRAIPDSTHSIIGSGSSTNLIFPANGSYTVWLIVENPGSAYCIDSISETVNISNVDSLHASFITSNVYDTLGNYLYIFTSTSTGVNGVTMYKWDAGDTTGADSGVGMTNYQHYYKYAGTHIATLSIWFTQYPSMPHSHGNTGVYNRYDFSSYSMPIDVGVTGITNVSSPEAEFKLYPNPNNGTFKIALNGIENSQNAELQITNILGEVIYTAVAHPSNGMILQDISLPNIYSGTYFVRVITADRVYNSKTIITR